ESSVSDTAINDIYTLSLHDALPISYSDYIKPLELDVTGILVPHIMGVEDAKEVIRMTRFHPLGRRPIDGGNADGAYTGTPLNERSEEHTSELQSRENLVCRLLLEKK